MTIATQLGDDRPGPKTFDFSNTRHTHGRQLTRAEVMDAVGQFLATGDARHLPPAMRHEATGIRAFFAQVLAAGPPPGPPPPEFREMNPAASPAGLLRALTGDRASEPSGFEADSGP